MKFEGSAHRAIAREASQSRDSCLLSSSVSCLNEGVCLVSFTAHHDSSIPLIKACLPVLFVIKVHEHCVSSGLGASIRLNRRQELYRLEHGIERYSVPVKNLGGGTSYNPVVLIAHGEDFHQIAIVDPVFPS